MLQNFFKITLRNLWRNKSFSAINILGLAIGMAAAILILLWVQNELSYDRAEVEDAVRFRIVYFLMSVGDQHFNGYYSRHYSAGGERFYKAGNYLDRCGFSAGIPCHE